jgi:hypothetical protein
MVPIVQPDDPVPTSDKSEEVKPVTLSENTIEKESEVELVSEVFGANVLTAVDGYVITMLPLPL